MPYKLENQEIYWEVCLSQCPRAAIQQISTTTGV
jgi:hypothetical protein